MIESSYARAVLEEGCLRKGFPILPIHDSFITTKRHIGDLEKVMNETAVKMYGKNLRYKRKY